MVLRSTEQHLTGKQEMMVLRVPVPQHNKIRDMVVGIVPYTSKFSRRTNFAHF